MVGRSRTDLVHLPELLPGPRCYTDASTPSRRSILTAKTCRAGSPHYKSVLMAEAAAIALAAAITAQLGLHDTQLDRLGSK
jgi:hypothetical protein